MATDSTLISSAEAADLLGISRSTLTRRVKRGTIRPAMKVGGERGAFVFKRSVIERIAAAERERSAA